MVWEELFCVEKCITQRKIDIERRLKKNNKLQISKSFVRRSLMGKGMNRYKEEMKYNFPISESQAIEITERNENLKTDYCKHTNRGPISYLRFDDRKVDVVEINNKKYWQIQILAGDVSGMNEEMDKKYKKGFYMEMKTFENDSKEKKLEKDFNEIVEKMIVFYAMNYAVDNNEISISDILNKFKTNYIFAKKIIKKLEDTEDSLLIDAIEFALETEEVKNSSIRNKFAVSYARAGRIIDQLEERDIISKTGEGSGKKPIIAFVEK